MATYPDQVNAVREIFQADVAEVFSLPRVEEAARVGLNPGAALDM